MEAFERWGSGGNFEPRVVTADGTNRRLVRRLAGSHAGGSACGGRHPIAGWSILRGHHELIFSSGLAAFRREDPVLLRYWH